MSHILVAGDICHGLREEDDEIKEGGKEIRGRTELTKLGAERNKIEGKNGHCERIVRQSSWSILTQSPSYISSGRAQRGLNPTPMDRGSNLMFKSRLRHEYFVLHKRFNSTVKFPKILGSFSRLKTGGRQIRSGNYSTEKDPCS